MIKKAFVPVSVPIGALRKFPDEEDLAEELEIIAAMLGDADEVLIGDIETTERGDEEEFTRILASLESRKRDLGNDEVVLLSQARVGLAEPAILYQPGPGCDTYILVREDDLDSILK